MSEEQKELEVINGDGSELEQLYWQLIQFNTPEDVFQSYYVISCDKVKIIEQYKQEFQAFPKLTFFIFPSIFI